MPDANTPQDAPGGLTEVAALREKTARLESELAQAREDIRRLEGLAQLGRMAGSVAHEVRNPLAALMAAAEVLICRAQGQERLERLARVIIEEAGRIDKIIADLVGFARDVKGAPQPTSLSRAVEELVAEAGPALAQAGVTLHTEMPPGETMVLGDHRRLLQVLRNVVDNSRQAMPQGGVVEIKAVRRMDAAGKDIVRLTISDTGPGFPPGKEQEVFDPFYTTKTRGVGLGLAVCRKFIRHDGGAVEAFNAPEGGAVIAIELRTADE